MIEADLLRVSREAVYLVLLMSAPTLLASLAIGLVVSLLQATTQVQEQTLTFVPKLVGVFLVLLATGSWMGAQIVRYTSQLWHALPGLFP